MKDFIELITGYLTGAASAGIKGVLTPLVDYLRRLGVGVVFIAVSVTAWVTTFLLLLLGLFFNLAHYYNLVGPSLWTALASLIVGLLLIGWGLYLVRRPR